MCDTIDPIIVEQFFEESPERIWQSITNPEEMRQWFFENMKDFKAEKGFFTRFNVKSGKRNFIHLWTITEATPTTSIVYDWRYEGIEGIGSVVFELFNQGSGTLLRVSNYGLETFPSDIPEFRRESCEGGWNYFIKERLKHHLNISTD